MTAPDPAEVERMARVMALAEGCDPDGTFDDGRGNTEIVWRQYEPYASAAISAGYSRTADTLERAARIADTAHLVPPDGGSPTEAECNLARDIAAAIRAGKGEG